MSATPDHLDPGCEAALLRIDLVAATVGRYEIGDQLGQGGMAVVYLARDLTLEREVAIKVLPPTLARIQSFQERFLRETRTVAGLAHPNIVPIYAVENQHSLLFFVMGFVAGESLAERIRRTGPLPVLEVVRILREVGWALAYAHSRGVVHRDVKPENLMLEHGTGRALLTDFGIAQVPDSNLTAASGQLGTPGFMSPEQIAGDAVDGRSDVYSLGVVGFQALTGRLPFEAATSQRVLAMHMNRPAPTVATYRSLPSRLSRAIDRCLAKDPADRFASADLLIEALPASVASFTEVAPTVRNFHRAASLVSHQVVLLLIAMTLIALARPAAADVALPVLLFGSVAIVLQLRGRAQLLAAQGYSYDDFRAALLSERQARAEEAETLREASRPRLPHWTFWLGTAMGLGLLATWSLWSPRPPVFMLLSGLGLVGIALAIEVAGSPRRGRGLGGIIARLWSGPFGAKLFAALATRDPLPQHSANTGPTQPGDGSDPAWSNLAPAMRRAFGELRRCVRELEARRDEQLRREDAIDRVLASTPQGVSGSIAGGPADPAGEALLERRRILVESMRASAARVRANRERVELSIENLRLQLTRLRSGVGEGEDAMRDVAAAWCLLTASTEPAQQ
jgi:eukaryotic-like serine/threonine-protein kinase